MTDLQRRSKDDQIVYWQDKWAESRGEIERLTALCEAMLKTENDAVTWRRFKIDELQAELKRANAVVALVMEYDSNLIDTLAALEADDA